LANENVLDFPDVVDATAVVNTTTGGGTHERLRIAAAREPFLEQHRTVDVDRVEFGQREHVPGTAERARGTAAERVAFQRHQVVRLDQLKLDVVGERRDRVQPGRVHGHAAHTARIAFGQQQRALRVVPHLYGEVRLSARHEYRFPQARRHALHVAVVQELAERLHFHFDRRRRVLKKKKTKTKTVHNPVQKFIRTTNNPFGSAKLRKVEEKRDYVKTIITCGVAR